MQWFAVIILFSMSSAYALDAKVMAQKISTLLNSSCSRSLMHPSVLDETSAEIVYLRGSPIDAGNAPQAGQKLLDIANIIAATNSHTIKTEAIHHTRWRYGCEHLQQSSAKHIYLVGHSYGAAGAVKIAHCLKKQHRNVSFLSSISSYDLFAGVDVTKIPDNVVNHANYYTTDSSMPGYDNHRADNPDHTLVRNVLAEQKSSFPHLNVAEDIVALIALQIFADLEGKNEQIVLPKVFNANLADENINQFWICNPKFDSANDL